MLELMQNLRNWAAGVTVVAAFALAPAAAGANPITVNTTGDQNGIGAECSLREAIASANTNSAFGGCPTGSGADTIGFSVTGTIDLTAVGELLVNSDMQIQGSGAGLLTLKGGAPNRVLEVMAGNVTVSGLTVTGGAFIAPGFVIDGGGIHNDGTLTLDHVVVTGNKVQLNASGGANPSAVVNGGGISNYGTLTVRDSTVSANTLSSSASGGSTSNHANASGGGIYSQGPNLLTIDRSTVSGNQLTTTASGPSAGTGSLGGGIYNATFGSFTVTRSTITGNTDTASGGSAYTNGGGIFDDALKLNATGDTIAGNSGAPAANVTGAVMIAVTERIADSILANPLGGGTNCDGLLLSGGFNLESGNSCGLGASTDLKNTAPGLGPLASNGGPTQTLALLPGSAAIDKGNALGATVDQRGLPRVTDFTAIKNAADGSDIGAFELGGAPETKITKVKRKSSKHKATFRFTSSEAGSTFECKIDKTRFRPCKSPKSYKLKPGKKHKFRVRAINSIGETDATPAKAKVKFQ
jgi:CSLREA domain-containing protein